MPNNDIVINELIEPSTLRDQRPIEIELKFAQPKEKQKTGDNGPYTMYIYGCKYNGQDAVLFAYGALKKAIDEAGAGKGDKVSILKMGEGKSTVWEAWVEGKPSQTQVNTADQPVSRSEPRRNDPTLDVPVEVTVGFREHVAQYAACVSAAKLILYTYSGHPVEQSALQAMAFSLYRSAMDQGIEIPESFDHEENVGEERLPFDQGASSESVAESVAEDEVELEPFEPNPRQAAPVEQKNEESTGVGIGDKGADELKKWFKTAGVKQGEELFFAQEMVNRPNLTMLADLTPDEARQQIIPELKKFKSSLKKLQSAGFDGTLEGYASAMRELKGPTEEEDDLNEEDLDKIFGPQG